MKSAALAAFGHELWNVIEPFVGGARDEEADAASTPLQRHCGIQDQPFAAADAKHWTEKCDGRRRFSVTRFQRPRHYCAWR